MSYSAWLKYIEDAEKSSIISGQLRKIHYKFKNGQEMVEEYSMDTGVIQRRIWKTNRAFMDDPHWEIELGDEIKNPRMEDAASSIFVVRQSIEAPTVTKRITKRNIEWRIRNLPYPIETYSVSADPDQKTITVRTTNKKFFKNISVPELERCGLVPSQANISINHQYNTLIITYKKPKILCEMEVAVLKILQDVETETHMDNLLKELLAK